MNRASVPSAPYAPKEPNEPPPPYETNFGPGKAALPPSCEPPQWEALQVLKPVVAAPVPSLAPAPAPVRRAPAPARVRRPISCMARFWILIIGTGSMALLISGVVVWKSAGSMIFKSLCTVDAVHKWHVGTNACPDWYHKEREFYDDNVRTPGGPACEWNEWCVWDVSHKPKPSHCKQLPCDDTTGLIATNITSARSLTTSARDICTARAAVGTSATCWYIFDSNDSEPYAGAFWTRPEEPENLDARGGKAIFVSGLVLFVLVLAVVMCLRCRGRTH